MEIKTIEWNREKLYEQIWAKPLRTVAREYGLSDVGLAKVCKKLNIPRPSVGYWRRVECGYKPRRVPLPLLSQSVYAVSHLPMNGSGVEALSQGRSDHEIAIAALKKLEIRIPTLLADPHPIVSITMKALHRGKRDERGLLQRCGNSVARYPLASTNRLWGLLWGPRVHFCEFLHISIDLGTGRKRIDLEGVAGLSAIRSIR